MSEMNPKRSGSERVWWGILLASTAINCVLQIVWFWRFRAHNITMDGIAYIGLARHLADGNFKASLHGYWSPLTSWIIAASALFSKDFTLLGRLVTIGSFVLCLPLLYVLTQRLWRSRVAAALAVFWFSLARGIVAMAVGSIVADFVLTACILLYFILLLDALRRSRPATWVLLGLAHALAFLAKAIAMPWLAISSVLAVLIQNARLFRRLVASLLLAFLIPAAAWVSWGAALRTKYGVFTTGYQLRANLMINWRRKLTHHPRGDSLAFQETPSEYDAYMVGDTPWSTLQSFSLHNAGLLPMVLEAESINAPAALKETVILLTPAGALALLVMFVLLIRNVRQYRAEAAFTCIALISTLSLIAAYCMLVFDGRYVVPVVPVLIAICCPMLLPREQAVGAPAAPIWLQRMLLSLFVVSCVFFAVYWASPFRNVDRDFEVSCYQAANILHGDKLNGTLVSIGNGPYPEHGVGFEVGSYVSYLAGWRLVGGNSELPDSTGADELAGKVIGTKSDAIAIWGSPTNPAYEHTVEEIKQATVLSSASEIKDPYKGEVGTLILRNTRN
jgi:4-amino-4-deoxy-L-arabinose transferase-like glycosyltransferase